ncbi:hypothetical protein TSUD_289430 [Trifolium subterraneum]|uniref:TF-B3 domain-containing protein n=1 Tax=Trifolium subterraneum TaxID=3900 RepID=A0A2Z6M368_TRISU|nr:hypothetical protein TSUD_289430 [Trifolium subterraneum]
MAGVGDCVASSSFPASLNIPIPQRSFLPTVVKKLTFYDIQSGTLVLQWHGFGKSDFVFTSSDLLLIDYIGIQYNCKLKFSIDANGELYSKISGGWGDLCRAHRLVEGNRVRFALSKSPHDNAMHMCIYPHIGVQTTLTYPLGDGTELPLYVSQNYFV